MESFRSPEVDYRLVLGSLPDAVVAADRDQVIVYANEKVTKLFGWAPAELVGKPITVLTPPRLREAHLAGVERYLATGVGRILGRSVRMPALRRDESEVEVELTLSTVPVEGGVLFVASMRSVAERVRLEEVAARQRTALLESEDSFRLLVEQVTDYAIFLLDRTGRVATWNLGAERLKGYRADEIIGKDFSVFYPEADVKAGKPAHELEVAIRDGRVEDEGWRIRKDGSRFVANVIITALRDDRGELRGFGKVTRDVTEKLTTAERALRHSEDRFRALADNITQLAWIADEQGAISWYNRRWFDYTGKTLEEMQGWGWKTVHHPDHIERVMEKWRAALAAKNGWEDTFPLRGNGGAYRWFLSRAVPVRDDAGRVLLWFGTNTDVTDQRETQEALSEAVEARERFLATAAHELKNPLNAVLLAIDSLRGLLGTAATDRVRGRVEMASRQTHRAVGLLDYLLDVSRITQGRLRLDLEEVDAVALVREVVARDAEDAARAGSVVHVRGDGSVVGKWDRGRLDQVVTNLLSNALKYGAQRPVDVMAVADDATLTLTVRDQGIGIAPEDQARIFERFERAVGLQNVGGLGLGLWIVRQVVEAMGGAVALDSAPGRGSTFTVTLPRGASASGPERPNPHGAGSTT